MPIPLAKKSGSNPFATDDESHAALAADPAVPQFPSGGTFGSTTMTMTQSTTSAGFGNPGFSGGMGAPAQQQPNLTQAGDNAATGADVLVKNDNTDWINKKWRPAMGWLYMLTCFFDFVVFPVLWSVLQAMSKGQVTSQWQPLTLQGAGLYHIAMGAVLGIAAYGRTKEKIEGAAK
jgi:Holin of 3TMs, for gene-transfer release